MEIASTEETVGQDLKHWHQEVNYWASELNYFEKVLLKLVEKKPDEEYIEEMELYKNRFDEYRKRMNAIKSRLLEFSSHTNGTRKAHHHELAWMVKEFEGNFKLLKNDFYVFSDRYE